MENPAQPDPGDIALDLHAAEFSEPFLRLNFATVWVRDQERSRRFFVEQLGFQVAVDTEVPGSGRWIIATPPTGLPGIALVAPHDGSAEVSRIGQNTGVGFLTEDVRALFEEWSNHGVRFVLPPTQPSWGRGQARYAIFEDVDGNRYSLIEIDEATRAVEAERRAKAARLEAERRPLTTWQSLRRYNHASSRSGAFTDVVSPASTVAVVRTNYVNSVDASDGLAFRLRTMNQTLSLETAAGYDDVTGLGTPTAAILGLR
jgi:catechol 2,3-dioxygenase-like lactoylglutathione lyase family enzyme